MGTDGNSIEFIRDMSVKAVHAAHDSSIATYECELHFAYHKLHVAGAYLDAAQDALRRSRSDLGSWYVGGARRALEDARADYADAVSYMVPQIEYFMGSR